jgi:DNA-binding MarR family transcriptional regulator
MSGIIEIGGCGPDGHVFDASRYGMVVGMTQLVPGDLPAGLEDNLGWLLSQCFRAYASVMDRVLADLPHGPRGYQALSGAANCSADNQAQLAKQLGVDRTVMVYLVDDLERAGLVERIPDPNDRRSRLIRATPAGHDRLRETEAAISVAEAELLGALSADDQARLRSMLREIAAQVCSGKFEGPCGAAEAAQGCTGGEGMTAAVGQTTTAGE